MSNGNSSSNGASGSNVSQGEIVDSARRLLDLITSAERQRTCREPRQVDDNGRSAPKPASLQMEMTSWMGLPKNHACAS
ncbi:unnamed protein product [Arctogadus glacialis]